MIEKIRKTDEEWRRRLTPEQNRVARERGTEKRYSHADHDAKVTGVFHCVCCGAPLFDNVNVDCARQVAAAVPVDLGDQTVDRDAACGRDLGQRVPEHPFEGDGRSHPGCRPVREGLPRPAAARQDTLLRLAIDRPAMYMLPIEGAGPPVDPVRGAMAAR